MELIIQPGDEFYKKLYFESEENCRRLIKDYLKSRKNQNKKEDEEYVE